MERENLERTTMLEQAGRKQQRCGELSEPEMIHIVHHADVCGFCEGEVLASCLLLLLVHLRLSCHCAFDAVPDPGADLVRS